MQFRCGQPAKNRKPVGAERVTSDGYVLVKVEQPDKWRRKHQVVWESLHGPIPHGHCVIFADGDKANFAPDNLILVSKARNSFKGQHYFTTAQIIWVKENIAGCSHHEITTRFNARFGTRLTEKQIRSLCSFRKISNGRKNMPGLNAGQISPTRLPIGAEWVNPRGFALVKTEQPDQWRLKHIVFWEKMHGPIPPDHCVVFADGNKGNFDPDNLVLMHRRELNYLTGNRLGVWFDGQNLKDMALNLARLAIKIRECKQKGLR